LGNRIKVWKVISTKVIFDHPELKIVEDRVELPNGAESTYIKHAPAEVDAVLVVAINSKNEVLVQKEYSHPPAKVMWQRPGGSIKPNEKPKVAALRELSEESGYSAKKIKPIGGFYVHNRLSDKKQFVFECRGLFEKKLTADFDEFIENYWMSKTKLKQMIADGKFDNINLLAGLNLWFNAKK
jgi:ADP-ribose pyrophosphatase